MTHHNELHDGIAKLAGKYFTPLYLSNYPLTHTGCVVQEGKAQPLGSHLNNPPVAIETLEQNGDLLIHDL